MYIKNKRALEYKLHLMLFISWNVAQKNYKTIQFFNLNLCIIKIIGGIKMEMQVTVSLYHLLIIFIGLIGITLLFSLISNFVYFNFNICEILERRFYKKKYPLVSDDFIKMSAEQQFIENNQEIHECNKRADELEKNIEKLESDLSTLLGTKPQIDELYKKIVEKS